VLQSERQKSRRQIGICLFFKQELNHPRIGVALHVNDQELKQA